MLLAVESTIPLSSMCLDRLLDSESPYCLSPFWGGFGSLEPQSTLYELRSIDSRDKISCYFRL